MRSFLSIVLAVLGFPLCAQIDSLPPSQITEDLLENYSQDQEEEAPFDYNSIFDNLEYFRSHPLDLNEATGSDLNEFQFLSALQKEAFIIYRNQTGRLLSIYELQAVPGFDINTIQQLLPYVKITAPGLLSAPFSGWKTEGKSQLLLRWSRILEAQRGFAVPEEDTAASRYSGDRNRLYLRYKFTLQNRLSAGFTAEKDPGEEFFSGSNKQGFDFYSAHLFLRNPEKKLRAFAIGDYSVSLGQGLLLYQGFAAGKSSYSTSIKKGGRLLRPYTSVNEFDFYRGAAATYRFNENLELTTFVSSRKKDGNQIGPDDTDDQESAFISSLQTSGFHRTASEIEDKNAVRQSSAGASLKLKQPRWNVALNGLFENLDKPLQRTPALYNQFHFNGGQLFNMSADYSYTLRNYHFFGETALSDNGAVATLNGAMAFMDKTTEIAILHRHFPKGYHSLNPRPFAETAGARNEDGLYLGVAISPNSFWRLNGYFDLWSQPWPKSDADAPTQGHEWLVKLTYTVRKKMEAYVQLKNEVKEENTDIESLKIDAVSPRQNFQARLHLSYKPNDFLEWRSRINVGFSEFEGNRQKGVSLHQDFIYKPLDSPFSFNARFAIFDTDSFDVRFYSFENDLLYAYSIPAYYGKGSRFYFNTRYRAGRSLVVEARYGRTLYSNQEVNGSGLDEISGNRKSEVKLQVKWGF